MANGLIAGIMGGLAGGAQAMQQNAVSQIEQKRAEALRRLDHDLAMTKQEAQQEFTTSERIAGQEYGTGEREAAQDFTLQRDETQFGRTMSLEQYRQSQQNARSAMSRDGGKNDWQLMQTPDGLVQYSPSRNASRPANLPAGVDIGGGDLTDLQKYQLDALSDRMSQLQDRASNEFRELTPQEQSEMQRLQSEQDSILEMGGQGGGGGGSTALQRLMAGEGGGQGEASQGGAGAGAQRGGLVTQGEQIPDTPEPAAGSREEREARMQAADARDRADDVAVKAEQEMRGGIGIRPGQASGEVSSETRQAAEQAARDLIEANRNPNISETQKRWNEERLERLRRVGIQVER